ncbi:hypothetical protein TNCV_4257171 [Trichonephila clavipes]|nr:hypothetical protein TNCV_4257171 [Trichonephila clavipes]
MTANDYETILMTANDYKTILMTANDYKTILMTANDYEAILMTANDYEAILMTANDYETILMTANDYETRTILTFCSIGPGFESRRSRLDGVVGLMMALYTHVCGFQSMPVDFHDANNRQSPCRMIMRHVKNP